MSKNMNELLDEIQALYNRVDKAALHYYDGMVLVMDREKELKNRNAELVAENEMLRAQVAELLPWAATGVGRIMWDIGRPLGGTVAGTYVLLTPEDGRVLSARIDAGEFGEVAQ